MDIFKLIAGPLIGALIGYFTNFIAVKMLFRPHHPVMLGKRRLPFTPGLIPKRKDELAGAIGNAVGTTLLTKDDLTEALPVDSIKATMSNALWEQFCQVRVSVTSVGQAMTSLLSERQYETMRNQLEDTITERAVEALRQMNISEIIVTEGTRAIKEKVQGTLLAMMVNDQLIQSIAGPLGDEIQDYIERNGEAKIRPVIAGELVRLEAGTIGSLARQLPLEQEQIAHLVDVLYDKCVAGSIEKIVEDIDVAGIIEEKIKGMEIEKLEELILSVMKKELNAIVNLGALIGLVIGLLNLLISLL